jgi:hypothetical protein
MLGRRALKSSRLSCFPGLLTWSRRLYRFAIRYSQKNKFLTADRLSLSAAFIISFSAVIYPQAGTSLRRGTEPFNNYRKAVYLTEQIPKSYLGRYNKWKAALLSVDSGRKLWQKYAENPSFRLTITISKEENQGAKVDSYLWDAGKLAGATITLGSQLDYGFPNQFDYPVLGSLESVREGWGITGDDILAAAKFAHELGHLEHASSDSANFQIQNQLAPIYVKRFLSNGLNPTDPVLKKLAERMTGVPLKIKCARENYAEIHALRYLLEKLKTKKHRKLMRTVWQSIQPEFDDLFRSFINSAGYAALIAPGDR